MDFLASEVDEKILIGSETADICCEIVHAKIKLKLVLHKPCITIHGTHRVWNR
jgi:hypothetical protein